MKKNPMSLSLHKESVPITLLKLIKILMITAPIFGSAYSLNSNAAVVSTEIVADITAFHGPQLPSALQIGDSVVFRYRYDDAGKEAHDYYFSGHVDTIPISIYPHLSVFSDASAWYSPNILETFGEYRGDSGYSVLSKSTQYWLELSGASCISDKVPPSAITYLCWKPGEGRLGSGTIRLWGADPEDGHNIIGNVVSLEFRSLSTTEVPLPGTISLFTAALASLVITRGRVASHMLPAR